MGDSLHNLRFPTKLWEADWIAKSGFDTNRIRYPDMIKRLQYAEFDLDVIQVDNWDRLPAVREKISGEFLEFSDDELCISGFDILLRKNNFGACQ